MNDLLVLTANYDPPEAIRYLRSSCEKREVPLLVFGGDGPWPGHVETKLKKALEVIKKRSDKVIMWSDGHDSFITAQPSEILSRFYEMGRFIVLSAETNCFPDAHVATRYPPSETPWRYVNTGGWIGKREALIDALEWMCARDWKDDQEAWTRYFLENQLSVALDCYCRIFQTMGASPGIADDGLNTISGTRPYVWHWNGRTPGIAEWYGRLAG